ncbi:MAG: hypothetical protein FWD00_03945 [Clostridiales bacterium]|nr:hypothetical protein [Clostridiales bacterium]
MKRYKKWLAIPAAIVIVVSILPGFASPNADTIGINLIKERANILQQTLYGQMSRQEAERRLAHIQTHPLLSQDIQSIRAWEPAELDVIRRMHIDTFDQVRNALNYLTYQAVIYWDMTGLNGNYTVKGTYHVVLKRENDHYRLSIFEPIHEEIVTTNRMAFEIF